MNTNEAQKGIRVLAASRGVDGTLDRLQSLARQVQAAVTASDPA
jgi:hypothetical protein